MSAVMTNIRFPGFPVSAGSVWPTDEEDRKMWSRLNMAQNEHYAAEVFYVIDQMNKREKRDPRSPGAA